MGKIDPHIEPFAEKVKIVKGVDIFRCEIQTPQFLGSQEKFYMLKQKGTFVMPLMKFFSASINGHNVQFDTLKDLEKALIRIY